VGKDTKYVNYVLSIVNSQSASLVNFFTFINSPLTCEAKLAIHNNNIANPEQR